MASPLGLQMRTDPLILLCIKNGGNSLFVPIICSPSLASSTARGSTEPTSRQPQVLRQHMDQWAVPVPAMELFWLWRPTHVEGWHSHLKKAVWKSHPNIFELIKVIKKDEVTTWMKISLYESKARTSKEKKERCNGRNTSIDEYLDSFKHHTGL